MRRWSEREDNGCGIWGKTTKLRMMTKWEYEKKKKEQREWLENLPVACNRRKLHTRDFLPRGSYKPCWAEALLSFWTFPLVWLLPPLEVSFSVNFLCFRCLSWVCLLFCFNTRTWEFQWILTRHHCLVVTDRHTRQGFLDNGHLTHTDVIGFILLLLLI